MCQSEDGKGGRALLLGRRRTAVVHGEMAEVLSGAPRKCTLISTGVHVERTKAGNNRRVSHVASKTKKQISTH